MSKFPYCEMVENDRVVALHIGVDLVSYLTLQGAQQVAHQLIDMLGIRITAAREGDEEIDRREPRMESVKTPVIERCEDPSAVPDPVGLRFVEANGRFMLQGLFTSGEVERMYPDDETVRDGGGYYSWVEIPAVKRDGA